MMTFKTKHFSDARAIVLVSLLLFSLNACAGSSDRVGPSAGNLQVIELLTPQLETGRLLMAALSERRSQRDFSEKELPLQVLSHLLWAGFGINRPKAGKRTAPSAMNWQEVDIYVALEKGLYLYDAEAHRLRPRIGKGCAGSDWSIHPALCSQGTTEPGLCPRRFQNRTGRGDHVGRTEASLFRGDSGVHLAEHFSLLRVSRPWNGRARADRQACAPETHGTTRGSDNHHRAEPWGIRNNG